ncbi:MAG: hypothetical protein HY586_00185, partial [Candidatus Omnitrophica bacterium]|nr:hypothetical protein [Candidatus Omnitrophota bacterium]
KDAAILSGFQSKYQSERSGEKDAALGGSQTGLQALQRSRERILTDLETVIRSSEFKKLSEPSQKEIIAARDELRETVLTLTDSAASYYVGTVRVDTSLRYTHSDAQAAAKLEDAALQEILKQFLKALELENFNSADLVLLAKAKQSPDSLTHRAKQRLIQVNRWLEGNPLAQTWLGQLEKAGVLTQSGSFIAERRITGTTGEVEGLKVGDLFGLDDQGRAKFAKGLVGEERTPNEAQSAAEVVRAFNQRMRESDLPKVASLASSHGEKVEKRKSMSQLESEGVFSDVSSLSRSEGEGRVRVERDLLALGGFENARDGDGNLAANQTGMGIIAVFSALKKRLAAPKEGEESFEDKAKRARARQALTQLAESVNKSGKVNIFIPPDDEENEMAYWNLAVALMRAGVVHPQNMNERMLDTLTQLSQGLLALPGAGEALAAGISPEEWARVLAAQDPRAEIAEVLKSKSDSSSTGLGVTQASKNFEADLAKIIEQHKRAEDFRYTQAARQKTIDKLEHELKLQRGPASGKFGNTLRAAAQLVRPSTASLARSLLIERVTGLPGKVSFAIMDFFTNPENLSFPRKRESSVVDSLREKLSHWIPAFAGMTRQESLAEVLVLSSARFSADDMADLDAVLHSESMREELAEGKVKIKELSGLVDSIRKAKKMDAFGYGQNPDAVRAVALDQFLSARSLPLSFAKAAVWAGIGAAYAGFFFEDFFANVGNLIRKASATPSPRNIENVNDLTRRERVQEWMRGNLSLAQVMAGSESMENYILAMASRRGNDRALSQRIDSRLASLKNNAALVLMRREYITARNANAEDAESKRAALIDAVDEALRQAEDLGRAPQFEAERGADGMFHGVDGQGNPFEFSATENSSFTYSDAENHTVQIQSERDVETGEMVFRTTLVAATELPKDAAEKAKITEVNTPNPKTPHAKVTYDKATGKFKYEGKALDHGSSVEIDGVTYRVDIEDSGAHTEGDTNRTGIKSIKLSVKDESRTTVNDKGVTRFDLPSFTRKLANEAKQKENEEKFLSRLGRFGPEVTQEYIAKKRIREEYAKALEKEGASPAMIEQYMDYFMRKYPPENYLTVQFLDDLAKKSGNVDVYALAFSHLSKEDVAMMKRVAGEGKKDGKAISFGAKPVDNLKARELLALGRMERDPNISLGKWMAMAGQAGVSSASNLLSNLIYYFTSMEERASEEHDVVRADQLRASRDFLKTLAGDIDPQKNLEISRKRTEMFTRIQMLATALKRLGAEHELTMEDVVAMASSGEGYVAPLVRVAKGFGIEAGAGDSFESVLGNIAALAAATRTDVASRQVMDFTRHFLRAGELARLAGTDPQAAQAAINEWATALDLLERKSVKSEFGGFTRILLAQAHEARGRLY